MIHLIADERHACAHAHGELTIGSRGIPVQVGLSDDFDGLAVTICFQAGTERAEVVWYEGEEINVPPQCLTKEGERLLVGVYGAKADGTVVIPTIWATAGIVKRGTNLTGASPLDPEPDWTAQVQSIAAEAIETANSVREDADAGRFDGFSPSASVAKSGDTATITITDKDGTTTASIRDGYDTSGSVVQDGTTAIITLTDHDGTTRAEVHDGISPSASVAQTETGATVTITDRSGTTTAQIANGATGPQGERGPAGPKGDTGDGATRIEYGSGIILVQCDSDGKTKAYGGGFDVRAYVGAERQACTAAISYAPSWLTINVTNNASGTPTVRYSWQQGQAASNATVGMTVTTTDVSGAEVTYPCTLNVTTVRDGAAGVDGEDGYGFVPVDGTFVPIHTNPDNTTRAGRHELIFEAYSGSEELAITGMTFQGPSWITATQSSIAPTLLVLTWPDGETLVDSVGCSLTVTIDDHGTTRYEYSEIVVGAVKDGADGISPTVTVFPITGGHEVTVTDAGGSQSFDVMDGKDGGQKLTKALSGTLLTAEDAYAAPPVDATVYGVSEQTITTGKNVFDPAVITGCGYTESDGVYTGNLSLFFRNLPNHSYSPTGLKENTAYVFRLTQVAVGSTATGNRLQAKFVYSDGTKSANYTDSGLRTYVWTSDASKTLSAIEFSYVRSETFSFMDVMLAESSLGIDYEPYSGGIASPSPDWMQPIESVDALTLHATGKNLLDYNYFYDTTPAYHGNYWDSYLYPYELPPGTYTMSCNYGTGAGNAPYGFSIQGSGTSEAIFACYAGHKVTITLHEGEHAVVIRRNSGGDYVPTREKHQNGTIKLQVELGSTATAYESHVGTSVPVDLQGHELRSLPDGTKDELTLTPEGTAWRVTLTQRVGSTTTAATDGITGTVGVDVMSTTGEIADGPTVTYKLATEQTIDLGTVELPANPAPDMTAWADGGSATPSLSLTYERDITIAFADMQAEVEHVWAQLAPVEQETATANHAVGTYLVLGGTLCKVTRAIAIGETVAIGTNVAATTVAAELLAIQA